MVTGLVVSFTFATVARPPVDALGLPNDFLRTLAIAVLGFAVLVCWFPVSARIEAWLTRVAPGAAGSRGDGFGSGLVLGASLGLVYAPCAGPILAGVITVSASQDFTAGRLAVALSYGARHRRRPLRAHARRPAARSPLARPQRRVQRAIGVVMIAVAVLMAAELDLRFQNTIADALPAALVNPRVSSRRRRRSRTASPTCAGDGTRSRDAAPQEAATRASHLPVLGDAPEIVDTQRWFNTPGGGLSLAARCAAGWS